jgi:LiaF transmembrane domain/Cell wall-active antibiotics response LiaF, C-terminal
MRDEFRGVSATKMPLTPRVIIGMLIVGFGAALLLDNLGIMEAGDLIRYWPFGLIAIGLAKLLQDQDRSGRIAGGLFVGIGALIAVENFLFVRLDFWRWWPLAVVGFGILILVRAFRGNEENRQGLGYGSPGGSTVVGGGLSAGKGGGTMEQSLSEFAMWSGLQRRVASPAFRRAELTAFMGGIELDLRQAGTESGEAVVDVFVMWGGIEITVPPDWAVSNQITPILGGSEDKSTGTQQARNRLIVKGVVIMGGVDIKT